MLFWVSSALKQEITEFLGLQAILNQVNIRRIDMQMDRVSLAKTHLHERAGQHHRFYDHIWGSGLLLTLH
jgi:hypothetical protein